MNNVSDIIEALGGCSSVAKAIGRGASAVSEMKRRGTIPVTYWPAITAEASRKGLPITNDKLVEVHTDKHVLTVVVAPIESTAETSGEAAE